MLGGKGRRRQTSTVSLFSHVVSLWEGRMGYSRRSCVLGFFFTWQLLSNMRIPQNIFHIKNIRHGNRTSCSGTEAVELQTCVGIMESRNGL